MYEQETLSNEKENLIKNNNIIKKREPYLRIEETITV